MMNVKHHHITIKAHQYRAVMLQYNYRQHYLHTLHFNIIPHLQLWS
jgi:hypothetical protein